MARPNEFIYLIGLNGTGKSTTTHELIQIALRGNPNLKLKKFDPHFQFTMYPGSVINAEDKDWAERLNDFETEGQYRGHPKVRNTLLVMDDWKILHEGNFMPKGFKTFLINRRIHGNEIIVSVHSPNDVLEGTKNFVTKYYFFHTKARESVFRERLAQPEYCVFCSNIVNNYYMTYFDMIKHPNDPMFKVTKQTFPYMVFDTAKRSLMPKNMDRPLIINGRTIL